MPADFEKWDWISFSCEGRCTSVPRPNKKRKTRKWLGFDVQAIFPILPSAHKCCYLSLHKVGRNRLCFYNMCGSAHFIASLIYFSLYFHFSKPLLAVRSIDYIIIVLSAVRKTKYYKISGNTRYNTRQNHHQYSILMQKFIANI